LSYFKRYLPSENLKLNYLGIFKSLELRILMEKIFSLSLKLNFTSNTLGCFGLKKICENIFSRAEVGHIDPQKREIMSNLWRKTHPFSVGKNA